MKTALSRKNLWERAPRALRALAGCMAQRVPTRYLLGRRFRDTLQFVRQAQWWSAERARQYQKDEIRRICTLAYEKSTYYRRSFDAVGFRPGDLKSLSDLNGLPLIDKDTVAANLDAMRTVSFASPGVDYTSTGGSSGNMLRFYIGADRSATEYAYLVASWERAGYGMEMAQAIFRGQIADEDHTGLRHQYDPILRRHYYSNFHMTDERIRGYLAHIATIGPCFLHVYPSSANALVSSIDRQGLDVPQNIRGILAGSENVYLGDRDAAQRVFGVRYLSWYGHVEKLVLASECEHSTHYHVWPTYGYCELLDDSGAPVEQVGQVGEIVGTGFINRVVPFVRYRTGDRAVYGGEKCDQCGREHMILTEIEGRWPQGCLVARDGALISMTSINLHDDTLENVVEYQFFQDTKGVAVFRIVPERSLTDEEKDRIIRRMNDRLQGQVALTLEIRPELTKTPRGKLVRVIQRIPGVAREGGTG